MRWTAVTAAAALALASLGAPLASPASSAPQVSAKQPAPGVRLRTYFPVVSASVDPAPKANSLRVFLDGHEVSASTAINDGTLKYVPRERVSPGWHDVFVEGTGANDRTFFDSWAFQTEAPDFDQGIQSPDFQFFPSGGTTFFPGSFMHFFFIGPGDGFAALQLCGLGVFPFQHVPFSPVFFVTVPVPELTFNPFLNCQVAALFTPIAGFSPFFVPLPVGIGIFSPHHHHHWMTTGPSSGRTTMPVFRGPGMGFTRGVTTPAYGSQSMPVYRSQPMPGYRTTLPMPVYRSQPMPVYRAVPMPLPRTVWPGTGTPVMRPISVPRPVAPVRPHCCSY